MTIQYQITNQTGTSQNTLDDYYFDDINITVYSTVYGYLNSSGFYLSSSANNYFQFTNGSIKMDAGIISVGGNSVPRWLGSNLSSAPVNDVREGDMWHLATGKVYVYTSVGSIVLN